LIYYIEDKENFMQQTQAVFLDEKDKKLLERMATAQEQIAAAIGKPKHKIEIVLEYLTAIVSIMGIIAIVDVVIKWIFGG
jgi:hypothetical protein